MKRSFALFAIFALALTYSASPIAGLTGLSPDSAPPLLHPGQPRRCHRFQIAVAQTNEASVTLAIFRKYAPQQTSLKTSATRSTA